MALTTQQEHALANAAANILYAYWSGGADAQSAMGALGRAFEDTPGAVEAANLAGVRVRLPADATR